MRDILPELNGKEYIEALKEDYEIRFCKIEEGDQLIDFLKKYWKENHIFVLCRELFDWQHLDKKNDRYNYVVARHKKTGEFHSVLGFVPTSQFDDEIGRMEVWPCIWKSRDDIHVKGLGVALYAYLKNTLPIETIAILGISEIALSIYKHWNFTTGKVKQFYILNEEIQEYHLLKNYQKTKRTVCNNIDQSLRIELCTEEEFENLSGDILSKINKYKSLKYYKNRFFEHPVYKYQAYKVVRNSEIRFVMITRENVVGTDKCLRIVDFIGDMRELCGCSKEIQKLLRNTGFEYIDFICTGINEQMLLDAGFNDRDRSDIIIPNYFEPFLLENIALDYAFKTVVEDAEAIFVKADADQDRPNVL